MHKPKIESIDTTIKPHFDALNSPVARLAYRLGAMEVGVATETNRVHEIMADKYKQARGLVWEKIPPDEERFFALTEHTLTAKDCMRIVRETRDYGKWSM